MVTVAGAGAVDRLVEALAWPPTEVTGAPVDADQALTDALEDVDLVIVENLCSLPLRPSATELVAAHLKGRPAVLHHHDLPWQRARFADVAGWPPDDRAWRHVTINELSRHQLADRGIDARTIYNGFDPDPAPGDRDGTRRRLGVEDHTDLALHPVRAIERKGIPTALKVSGALDATYWLTGPAEEGYDGELAGLLAGFGGRVLRGPADLDDAYAAADVVLFTSHWEGFGNPPIEAALRRRLVVVGDYPVADELAALGFRWFGAGDVDDLRRVMTQPERDELEEILDTNQDLARASFSFDRLDLALAELLADLGVATSGPR